MILPDIWSQGQLFAFSALDGESYAGDDFAGQLSGDKIGIRFFTKIKRELMIVNTVSLPPEFEAVTSDYISIRYGKDERVQIVYADRHLVIGTLGKNRAVPLVEGEVELSREGDITIQDTKDGEMTAFLKADGFFAFAFGKSRQEVTERLTAARQMDLNEIIAAKRSYFERNPLDDAHPYAKLYAKCLSTMKTQLYSPEGFFKEIWSTPDRLPHKFLWLWDSVFHAIGFRNIDPHLAEILILDLFAVQGEDGFIPHCSTPSWRSGITQPPVIAWGALKVFEKSGNTEFLKTVFAGNKRFLLWCRENRKLTDKELYTWNTHSDVNCRCDESGMDNSPRFDIHERLFAIDFSCFLANETRMMAKIAAILGEQSEEDRFNAWNARIVNDINEALWCEEDGFYYDVVISQNRFHKVSSVASFLPLFAGVCTERQAKLLVKELKNPETFYTEFPIPSISKKDPLFGSDMWRGPVWINYNYMIGEGLLAFGFEELANDIFGKTAKVMNEWYQKNGTVYEYYDSDNMKSPDRLNRKGAPVTPYDITVKYQTIREYGWSNTLLLDILADRR